jgi:ABC-2 type transport system permease protein
MRLVFALEVRSLIHRRRMIALGLLACMPALAGLAEAFIHTAPNPGRFTALVVQRLALPAVAALVTIIIAASTLGDEREDATILYLTATPLARWRITVGAAAAAWLVASALVVPFSVIAAAAPGTISLTGTVWVAGAALIECGAYAAVFVGASLVTRRPVVIGIVYVLVWEGTIASFAPSAARFSISAYARVIAAHGLGADGAAAAPNIALAGAVAVLIIVSAAALAGASRALRRVELP